jgi:hypothetical protein
MRSHRPNARWPSRPRDNAKRRMNCPHQQRHVHPGHCRGLVSRGAADSFSERSLALDHAPRSLWRRVGPQRAGDFGLRGHVDGTEERNERHADQRRGLPSTGGKALRIEDNTIQGTLLASLTGGTRNPWSDGRRACSHSARRTCAAARWAGGCYLTSLSLSCWISSTCGRADFALLSQT